MNKISHQQNKRTPIPMILDFQQKELLKEFLSELDEKYDNFSGIYKE